MHNFVAAMQKNTIRTENDMPTNTSSGSKVLDLFYRMGALRDSHATSAELGVLFGEAFAEDPSLTLKALFYNRDVREGQGERNSFRYLFNILAQHHAKLAIANLGNIPFYGRWDDLYIATSGTDAEKSALEFYAGSILNDKLAAKWAPREGKKLAAFANKLRKHMELSWKDYRKLLAGNTEVVESLMCSNRWNEINFSHTPSQAARRYRKAFSKHEAERYKAWLEALKNPEVAKEQGIKINAGATFPHEIVHAISSFIYLGVNAKYDETMEAQWKALPNYMPEGKRILPMCDVSGSMTGQPMEVSIALGLYLSERNIGPYHNAILSFAGNSQFFVVNSGTLQDRVNAVSKLPWTMNTNISAAFKAILEVALVNNLKPEEMPEMLLIISDMQFDATYIEGKSLSAMQYVRQMYANYGYAVPQIVFWNVRDSNGVPARHDESGATLISGFSPSIMKHIMNGEEIKVETPYEIMVRTLNSPRYDRVITSV